MIRSLRSPVVRQLLLGWLVFALLLLPAMGFVHGILHGHQLQPGALALAAPPAVPQEGAPAWLGLMIGDHQDEGQCAVFDRLAQAGGACASPPAVLPLLLASAAFQLAEAEFFARWAALFDARGPPASR